MAELRAKGVELGAGQRPGLGPRHDDRAAGRRRARPLRAEASGALADYDRGVVSTLVLRLLGPPEIERDGVVVRPPRGHKAWAVLAYLVLAERPVSRTRLAALVFGDAEDPRGALRWTLAQLRRALGVAGALGGDPVELGLPPATVVDVLALAAGEADPAWVRGELLEGIDPGAGAEFDAWLLVERRRLAGVCEARVEGRGAGALAAGRAARRRGAGLARGRAEPVRRRRARVARALPRAGGPGRRRARARGRVRRAVPPRAGTRARIRACAGPPRSASASAAARRPRRGRGPARRGARRRGCRRGRARRRVPAGRRAPRRAASAIRRCWHARWRRSAPRWCIRSAAATRRARRCCTRRSRSPRPPLTARSSARPAASSASSRSRPAAGCRRAAGWGAPARWRPTTGSVRPCSACAARRCPTGRTTRRRSACCGSRSRRRGAAATSARRRGRWRSSGRALLLRGQWPRRRRCSTTRSRWSARTAGWRSSPSRRR